MDDQQKSLVNSQENSKDSVVNKTLSIKVLQVLFIVWGSLSLFYFVINSIFGSNWFFHIPSPLSYLLSLLMIVDPEVFYILGVDTRLFPLVVGIGALLSGLGILQSSKNSLNIVRFYICALLLIIVGYFVTTIPSLPILFKAILELNSPSQGWDFTDLIIISALGELILVSTLIFLIFALIKIQNLLKTNASFKASTSPQLERFSKITYLPLILMLIWFCYGVYSYYQSSKPRDEYGVQVSTKSSEIISENKTSPDNSYTVKESLNPPKQIIFAVYDKDGNVVREIAYNIKKEIVDSSRTIGCDCDVSFKGWINNHTFVIKTIKEDGKEYEDIIDIKKLVSE